MNRQKKSKLVRRRRDRSALAFSVANRIPPEFNTTIKYQKKFRFRWASSGAFNVTRARLLDLLSVAATSTTAYRVNQAVRILSVKMWGFLAVGNTTLNTNDISLEWVGIYAESRKLSASSMGTAYPAYIESIPPENQASHWWSQSGGNETEILFVVSQSGTTSYTIIDVTLDCAIVDDEPATATAIAPTGATVGTVYYAPLDGATLGNAVPVAVNVLP